MPAGPLPAWVAAQPLWRWFEIPNTRLASIDPAITPPGFTGPSSKIDTWCGATLKRAGSIYMLGAAGGHKDYSGNEVNALALNADAPRWVQLRGPTPNDQIISYGQDMGPRVQFYLDLRPSAAHTYYATQFIDGLNRMVVFASQGYSGPSNTPVPAGWPNIGDTRSFSFNLGTNDWDTMDYVARFPGDGDYIACLCVKHQGTGDVYYSRNYGDGWYCWSAGSNSWRRLSGTTRSPWYAGAALDPRRNRILVAGGYNSDPPAVYDLGGNRQGVSFGGLGASELSVGQYPGAVYDEVLDAYLVFHNSANSIVVSMVNASTWSVSRPAISGPVPAARTNGLHNAAQYVPELRGVVLANKHDGNVLFMRTSS